LIAAKKMGPRITTLNNDTLENHMWNNIWWWSHIFRYWSSYSWFCFM